MCGLAGESGLLPPAECWGGMQGSCCLRSTLAVCPADKPRSEFTTRPPQHADKGTHAQRGQGPRQDKPHMGRTRKLSAPLRKAQTARPEELPYCSQSASRTLLKKTHKTARLNNHPLNQDQTPQSLQTHDAARNKKAPESHTTPRGTAPIACPQAADHRYSITRLSKQTC